uniref:SAM domain-containing protein n=1 Tax=Timema monikensis TaxID=170555 RepID=A0A7R9HIV0_9NEOP|nr:unnamed protein product [Timema monikensis]
MFCVETKSQNVQTTSDTVSEISDCGTGGTSASGQGSLYEDMREDLQNLANLLGIDVSELYEERFRVDRRKLEKLLMGMHDEHLSAEIFFQKIMEDTFTHIMWPSRLKIGAKSKKDPHVRIAGRPDDVKAARERVTATLDIRTNRATMKMDVSYTDHSHIIGKGGLSIKRVMEDTKCHIHFPDSNRSNVTEKSNQVSITGELEGVERAREKIRALMPLTFSFDLPIVKANNCMPDASSPYLQEVQEKYNVQVMFRTRPKLHSTLVVIKGCEWELAQVKEATVLLINHLCENLASQVLVQMTLEISPQHHPVVLGRNSINLKLIMQHTATQIMFPDAADPNIPLLKKSNVNITGSIHNVYLARQQLLVGNIYEARRQLMCLDEPRIVAQIPATYHIPDAPAYSLNTECGSPGMNNFTGASAGFGAMPRFPLPSGLSGWGSHFSSASQSPMMGNPMAPLHMLAPTHPLLLSLGFPAAPVSGAASSGYGSKQSLDKFPSSQSLASECREYNIYSSLSSNTSSMSSPNISPRDGSGSPISSFPAGTETDSMNMSLLSNLLEHDGNNRESLNGAHPPLTYDHKKLLAVQAMQRKPVCGEVRVPTSSWAGYGFSHSSPTPLQRNQSRMFDNMTNVPPDDPWTDAQSNVPSFLVTDYGNNGPLLTASDYLDSTPTSTLHRISAAKPNNIAVYLASLGLDKYTHLFNSNDIDLEMFPSLTENDLREIGVNALGARRRMLVAIAELKKQQYMFSGSAAPGAERNKQHLTPGSGHD